MDLTASQGVAVPYLRITVLSYWAKILEAPSPHTYLTSGKYMLRALYFTIGEIRIQTMCNYQKLQLYSWVHTLQFSCLFYNEGIPSKKYREQKFARVNGLCIWSGTLFPVFICVLLSSAFSLKLHWSLLLPYYIIYSFLICCQLSPSGDTIEVEIIFPGIN